MEGLGSSGPVGAAVFAIDTHGIITHWNRYAEALFGWSAAEAIGRKIREVVEGALDPQGVREAAGHLRAGSSWEGEAHIRNTDGTVTFCRLTLSPLAGEEGASLGMVGVAIDIGEQARVKRRQAVEHAVTRVLAEVQDLSAAAGRIIEAVCRSLGWEAGAVWYVDAAAGVVRCADFWHEEGIEAGEFEAATRENHFLPGIGLPGRVWASGQPSWIRDVAQDTIPRAAAAGRAGLHGAFGFPIRLGGRVLGMFEFFSKEIEEPDEQLLEAMAVLGTQIGQLIDRWAVHKSVEHSESLKSAMLEAALDCIVSMDAEGRIIEFNPAAERTFGYRREEVIGRPVAEAIIPPSLREQHRRGFARHLATGRRTILGQRLELTGMRKDGAEFPVELTITRVGLPGPPVFTAYLRDITARKEADEAVTRLLAAELEARAEAETQRRRLAFLAEASHALAGSLDQRRTLRRLAELAVGRIADWCLVYLQGEDGEIERVAIQGADPARAELARHLKEQYRIVSGAPGVPSVIRTGHPEFHPRADAALLAADVDDPEGLRRDLEPLGITSWICVPLTARGRTFGAVSFVSAESGRTYGEDDLTLAEDFAHRAAQAIDNARLYETQRSVARTLQEGLLPPELPEIPGIELAARYRPAAEGAEVGGDFYDAFELGEGRWAIMVGDVCGKGVEAAALTGLVRYTIRALAPRGEPSSVLLGVNDTILRQKSDEFCTLAYAEVENRGGRTRVRVCLAGHPLPFHVRNEGGVEQVGEPGTPLGLFPDPALGRGEVILEAGDALVLYTDGVIEEQARRGEGAEGLIARLAGCGGCDAATIAHTVEAWVAETGAASPRDDMAILVVRCSS